MNGDFRLEAKKNIQSQSVIRPLFGPVLLSLVLVVLVIWSWGRWPDVQVDFGRELYVPWQLTEGKVLYADLAYFNGPLSPWINSLLFRIFGVGLLTLVVGNLSVVVAVGAMLFWMIRQLGGEVTATAGTFVFLTIFAFSQYMPQGNYNFVTPYSHEMTHGMLFSLAALVALGLHLQFGARWALFACGLSMGLVFLTKVEYIIAIFPAVFVGIAIDSWRSGAPKGRVLRQFGEVASGIVLPPLQAFIVLGSQANTTVAWQGVLGGWPHLLSGELSQLKLYRDILGISEISENLGHISTWTLRYLIVVGLAALAAIGLPRSWRSSRLVVAGLIPTGAALVLVPGNPLQWRHLAQPLPFVLVIVAVAIGARLLRSRESAPAWKLQTLALSCVTFALLLLLKALFNVGLVHYGFALALPGAMVMVFALVKSIPAWFDRRGWNGAAFRALIVGLILGLAGLHLYATASWHRLRTVKIGDGVDAFIADDRGLVVQRVLENLSGSGDAVKTLAVIPEGVMLNYLAKLENPTPFNNFMPPEVIMFGEEAMIQAFQDRPPDRIVMLDRPMPEYGYQYLWDYAPNLVDWIEANYHLEERIGAEDARGQPMAPALMLHRNEADRANRAPAD